MLNYKSSMLSSKKYIQDDIPTAYKTNYQPMSPSRFEMTANKSKSMSKYENRITDARNNITDMVNQMSAKRDMNAEAAAKVRYTNEDMMAFINEYSNMPAMPTPTYGNSRGAPNPPMPTTNYSNMDNSPINSMQIESQQYKMPTQSRNQNISMPMPNKSSFISHMNTTIPQSPNMNNMSNRSNMANMQGMNLEEENLELRRALNQQIKENNMLMRKIQFLERENEELRNTLNLYMNRNFDSNQGGFRNNMEMNPQAYLQSDTIPKTAKFPSQNLQPNYSIDNMHDMGTGMNNYNNNMGINNYYSPSKGMTMPRSPVNADGMASPKNVGMRGNMGNQRQQYAAMYNQLQELKDYNQSLRQKTIHVLKTSV